MSTKITQKTENSIILGDVVAGNKHTTIININNKETSKLTLSEKVSNSINEASDSASYAIKIFKELNPKLDLKIKQTENSVNYLVEAIGTEEVHLGKILLKESGKEKFKKCIEEGVNVEFEDCEFEFNPDIKGLPTPTKDLTKSIQIINRFKERIEPIRIIILDSDRNTISEIFSNLHVLSCGSKIMTMKISGIQLVCDLNLSFNFIDSTIQDVRFNINYDSLEFDKLINTLKFFRYLKQQFNFEIILLDNDRRLFEINASNFDMETGEIDEQILFFNKYNKVVKYYSLNPKHAKDMSDKEYEMIEILFHYLDKTPIAFNDYPIEILINNPRDELISKIKNPDKAEIFNLTIKCNLTYDIFGKKIEIENHNLVLTKPYISKNEGNSYYIKTNRLIFNPE